MADISNRVTPPTVVAPSDAGPPPRMQILKRPSDAPKSRSTTPQNRPQKSLTQREEEYRLARERIFGSGAGEGSGSGTASPSSQAGSGSRDAARDAQQPQQQRDQSSGQNNYGQRDQGTYQRDFREPQSSYQDNSRGQSRESSASGRRRGNVTPRSGRASPDELSRDFASMSMRGGKPGAPGGPTPVLRSGMSPGVLRQPRGPSGAGFGRTDPEPEEKKDAPARAEFNRSTSDFSRNAGGPPAQGQGQGEFARNAPGDYGRNADYGRGDGYGRPPKEYARSAPPQVSRSSSYSSTASQGSYGFPGFEQSRGYIGVGVGTGGPAAVAPIGAGYATPYQQQAYAPYPSQPGFQQQAFQQTGYYARPAYAGQQLYGYSSAPGSSPSTPAKNGPGFERSAYTQSFGGGGSYGVPGGPPGPPSQQPLHSQPGRPPQQGQGAPGFYRPSPGAGAYGQ